MRGSLRDNAELSIDLKKYALRISPNFLFEDAFDPHEEIDRHAKTAGSWLENDSSYAYIRGLVLSQKIIVITQDITHHEVFQKIRCLLNDNGISIDTLYLSNVHDYIFSLENKLNFLKTFALLSDDNTWLIDSFAKALYLEQSITPCREINAEDKQRLRWFPGVSFPSPLENPPMTKALVKEPQNSLELMMALSWVTVTLMLYMLNPSQASSQPEFKF